MLSMRRTVPVMISIGLLVGVSFGLAAIPRSPQRTADAAESPRSYVLDRPIASATSAAQPVGYNGHVPAQPDPGRYVGLMESGKATSIRDLVEWAYAEPSQGQFDWSAPDQLVFLAAEHHLHALLTVGTTPLWASGGSMSDPQWNWLPPLNPTAYGEFAAAVAARYRPGGVFWKEHPSLPHYWLAGIELWNEENLTRFWGNEPPNPQLYAAMVIASYSRIKHLDPVVPVVTGGLAPAGGYNEVICNGSNTGHNAEAWNPLNYLQTLYADGIHGNFDAIGWHPYNFWNGATARQMLTYYPCSAWSEMAVTPVSVRSLMAAHGDKAKRIWITETGAPTCNGNADYTCVATVQQTALATAEYRIWRTLSWAGGFYWYDIRDDNEGFENYESHFGAVYGNDVPKPSYFALQQAWS
jgi:polysaccharide biosynthesis protein PslG